MKYCTLASAVLAAGLSPCVTERTHAGPLNPPFGAVASTGKTLTEVEPRMPISAATTPGDADSMYRIVAPGSYYLTANLFANPGRSGIEIASSNVTIDLNGFRIQGSPASLDGIVEDPALTHTSIRITNGNIFFLGGNGINLFADSDSHHIDHINVYSCGLMGIRCGNAAIIGDCISALNGSTGIASYGTAANIRNCNSYGNGGGGFFASENAVISDCNANNNSTAGFRTGNGAALSACSARGNGSDGFDIGSDSTVASCTAYGNVMEGFDVALSCIVTRCTSSFNHTDGILHAGSGSISDCSCYANAGDGIEVASDSKIRDNTCDNNGNSGDGAGIHVTGSDNVIEANHCTDTDRGIEVSATGNIIIRNTCAGNTVDWVIVANNVYGPIIDRRSVTTGAVNGFAATSTLSSTDANANFSH